MRKKMLRSVAWMCAVLLTLFFCGANAQEAIFFDTGLMARGASAAFGAAHRH